MLSKFSVKKPYTIFVVVIMILILGGISFANLEADLLPNIELPYLVIATSYPGASPEEVEMAVTKPIEQVVATTSNIKNINSISQDNSSLVILEFNSDVNMDSAIIEINGSLDLIKGMWDDSISSPMIIRLNPDMLPIMVSSVDMENMSIKEVSDFTNEKIIPELESIEGVAAVSGAGIVEENVEVYISTEKIEALNNKILDKIDSELGSVGSELEKAKNEIEEGKQKLNTEEKKQMGKIEEGEKALTTAKEQILQGEKAIDSGLNELKENRDEVQSKLDALIISEGDLAVQEELKFTLAQLDSKIEAAELEKAGLQEKKKEIAANEAEIVQGKSALKRETNKARTELNQGESKLNENIDEFEKKREEAFKQASLDGVITKEMISGILTAQNFSMPSGYISDQGMDYLVKVGDKIENIDEIKNLMLFDTGEEAIGKVYLKDVADVNNRDNSDKIYAKINGNNAVMLTFQKQSNFSTREITANINERMEKLTSENQGLVFTNLMDQGIYIDMVVNSVLKNIIYGGILAIIILFIFLRDLKPTFIIAISISISIIFAIAMMYFTGITINIISLAGLALGVGMLVDNSIVVIENIYRMRNEGESTKKAAVEGAREVAGALIASTLTTACVFLPIVFIKGLSKELFADMGLTIAYSLFASLLVALALVPAMASSMLANMKEKRYSILDKIIGVYEKALIWSLNHKGIVMVVVLSLFLFSGYLAINMGTSFIPEMETPQMSLNLKMPEDSSFQDLKDMSDKVLDRIINIEGIETIGAFQNQEMGSIGSSTENMSMYLILDEEQKIDNKEIEKEIKKSTADLDCKISVATSNMDMSALGGTGIEVLVKGREFEELREIALDISKVLEDTEGTTNVSVGIDNKSREMKIIVDKEKAMEKGLTVAQVFKEINSVISGKNTATTLSLSNKDYPVIVLDGKKDAITKGNLGDFKIKIKEEGEDREISLKEIAEIKEDVGPSAINRKSQTRYISVKSGIDEEHNIGLVSRDFEKKIKDYKLPEGYNLEIVGENKIINDALWDLTKMLLTAIAFIYLIMVAQFQSLLSPFIVMFTIPLAFTGGLLALELTGYDISLISMLGFLVLSGVVVNNGIVFVDYANQLREKGMNKDEALISAGKTRLQPILMTALTTIIGLSTLAFGMGVGAEMLQPLAIVTIGGLTYATVLTLLVVPVMYSLFHRDSKSDLMKGDEEI